MANAEKVTPEVVKPAKATKKAVEPSLESITYNSNKEFKQGEKFIVNAFGVTVETNY